MGRMDSMGPAYWIGPLADPVRHWYSKKRPAKNWTRRPAFGLPLIPSIVGFSFNRRVCDRRRAEHGDGVRWGAGGAHPGLVQESRRGRAPPLSAQAVRGCSPLPCSSTPPLPLPARPIHPHPRLPFPSVSERRPSFVLHFISSAETYALVLPSLASVLYAFDLFIYFIFKAYV